MIMCDSIDRSLHNVGLSYMAGKCTLQTPFVNGFAYVRAQQIVREMCHGTQQGNFAESIECVSGPTEFNFKKSFSLFVFSAVSSKKCISRGPHLKLVSVLCAFFFRWSENERWFGLGLRRLFVPWLCLWIVCQRRKNNRRSLWDVWH